MYDWINIRKQAPLGNYIFVTDGETTCGIYTVLFNFAMDDQRIAQLTERHNPLLKKNVTAWRLSEVDHLIKAPTAFIILSKTQALRF